MTEDEWYHHNPRRRPQFDVVDVVTIVAGSVIVGGALVAWVILGGGR